MNYSENLKRREERRKRINQRFRRMFTVALVMGLIIGFVIGRLTAWAMAESPDETSAPEVMTTVLPSETVPPVIVVTPEPEESAAPEWVCLGEYRITAYCACEKCCGEWAKDRPGGIVVSAAGIELVAGVSCASPLPFGTVVEVEGLGTYIVQDRTASWVAEKYDNKVIDIYFDSHEAACEFGLQFANVYVEEEPANDQMQEQVSHGEV